MSGPVLRSWGHSRKHLVLALPWNTWSDRQGRLSTLVNACSKYWRRSTGGQGRMRQGLTLTGLEKAFWEEIFTLSLKGESVRPRDGEEIGVD